VLQEAATGPVRAQGNRAMHASHKAEESNLAITSTQSNSYYKDIHNFGEQGYVSHGKYNH